MALSGLAACHHGEAGPASSPETLEHRRAIINGVADTNPAHGAVAALTYGQTSSAFCSATLIAPDVVLTAAHCVGWASPGVIFVYFGGDVEAGGQWVGVSKVMPHPRYSRQGFEWDIGLLRLSGPAPADATPIPALPAHLGLTVDDEGAEVEFVGFGRTESNTSGTKLTVPGSIARVCDGPEVCAYGGGGEVAPRAFAYSMSGGGPCSGDSGGPAFILRDGVEHVAGVTSYGDQDCVYYGVSTRPDSYASWIQAFVAGVEEDCSTAEDEDHDTLAGCADPDCDSYPACGPDACQATEPISCGQVVEGTTLGGTYQFRQYRHGDSRYGPLLGPERAFEVAVPPGVGVTARLTPGDSLAMDLFLVPSFGSSCATWDCLEVSARSGDAPEQIRFTADGDEVFLVVDTWDEPGPFTLELICDLTPEDCYNGLDDDGDGLIDCDDPDCAEDPYCLPPPENCANGIDDDGDGLIDCDDPDCKESRLCLPGPSKKKGCQQGGGGGTWLFLAALALLGFRVRRARTTRARRTTVRATTP